MKKVLFATTALVLSAGFAAADVSLSGYGRFGLSYDSGNDDTTVDKNGVSHSSKTWMEQRLRLDIKATTTTDSGLVFGGKFRVQYDDGDTSGATTNAAQFYFTYEGATVQVGNVTTALDEDTAGLFYGSETGLTDSSWGDSRSSFFAYSSKGGLGSQSGIYGKYTIDGFTAEASYIDPNQYGDNGEGVKAEKSAVLSYSDDAITVAAGATWNGAGASDNTVWYVGGKYAFNDQFAAGLNYIDEGSVTDADFAPVGSDLGKTITLYGTYTTGPVEVLAYVANYYDYDDAISYEKDTVYGIGANYDLGGGTTLKAALHRTSDSETYGELGVKFKF